MGKGGIRSMTVRKIGMAAGCILSGISVFLPFYFAHVNGRIVENAAGKIQIMPTFYGIAILATAILTLVFTIAGKKPVYIITSLLNAGVSVYACYSAYQLKLHNTYYLRMIGAVQVVNNAWDPNTGAVVVTGPGMILLITAAVLILLMMIWNAAGKGKKKTGAG